MDTNRNNLALRRRSIRRLTPDELGIAHGGKGGGGSTGQAGPCGTSTQRPTVAK
jgi:hypothetical protein